MPEVTYRNLSYLDSSVAPIDKSQTSFLRLHNFLANRIKGTLFQRGGSAYLAHVGDIYGISSYSLKDVSTIAANNSIPLRLRFDDPNYYIEKYDWNTDAWAEIEANTTNYLSYGIGGVASFVQISDMMVVCANRPAKIADPTSGKITRLGGSSPSTAPTATKASTGITGSVMYAYTFYDPTSGWESSPSPLTKSISCSNDGVSLSGMETTIDREGITKKRIYRTETSGELPLLYLDEVAIATTTYNDDGSIVLGDNMPDIADHEPPPDGIYIAEEHIDRLWLASQNTVIYTPAFDGSYYNLEYFSETRVFNFPFTVKAIKSAPAIGGLLVFGPPGTGIKIITGTSDDDFEIRDYFKGEGTNFHHSVTTKDDKIVYWGSKSPRVITNGTSDSIADFGSGFEEYLNDYINIPFTSAMYAWSLWHESSSQFLFGVAGFNSSIAIAEDESGIVTLEDFNGNLAILESPGSTGNVRQFCIGVLPDGQSHATFGWPMLEDGNENGSLVTCAHCPSEQTNVYKSNQDQIFLGTKSVGYTIRTFADEYGYDGYSPISSEFITNRIDPSLLIDDQNSDGKRFLTMNFLDTNPFEQGVELSFTKNASDPIKDDVLWEDLQNSSGKSKATFGHGLARWVNIKGTSNVAKTDKPMFGPFVLSFYRLYNRDKEGL